MNLKTMINTVKWLDISGVLAYIEVKDVSQ